MDKGKEPLIKEEQDNNDNPNDINNQINDLLDQGVPFEVLASEVEKLGYQHQKVTSPASEEENKNEAINASINPDAENQPINLDEAGPSNHPNALEQPPTTNAYSWIKTSNHSVWEKTTWNVLIGLVYGFTKSGIDGYHTTSEVELSSHSKKTKELQDRFLECLRFNLAPKEYTRLCNNLEIAFQREKTRRERQYKERVLVEQGCPIHSPRPFTFEIPSHLTDIHGNPLSTDMLHYIDERGLQYGKHLDRGILLREDVKRFGQLSKGLTFLALFLVLFDSDQSLFAPDIGLPPKFWDQFTPIATGATIKLLAQLSSTQKYL